MPEYTKPFSTVIDNVSRIAEAVDPNGLDEGSGNRLADSTKRIAEFCENGGWSGGGGGGGDGRLVFAEVSFDHSLNKFVCSKSFEELSQAVKDEKIIICTDAEFNASSFLYAAQLDVSMNPVAFGAVYMFPMPQGNYVVLEYTIDASGVTRTQGTISKG